MNQVLDKAFWALLLAIASYATTYVKDMSVSVQELNKNVAVVMQQLQAQDKLLERHETRLERLERLKDTNHGED